MADLGVGLGLRPVHCAHILDRRPCVPWFEAITESYLGIQGGIAGRPVEILERIRRDYRVSFHGVSLSIGSADVLKRGYLKNLKSLIERFEPLWVSDHICWTGVAGENLHDLMPLPYTEEAVDHLVSRISEAQDVLGRQLVFENVSSYVSYTHSTMTEWDFLSEICSRSGCGLLLDVNNIYVSASNHGFDPEEFLDGIAPKDVVEMHLAGFSDEGSYLLDAHNGPVAEPVWSLYRKVVGKFGAVPTIVEWDTQIPDFDTLAAEMRKAQAILAGSRVSSPTRVSHLEEASP